MQVIGQTHLRQYPPNPTMVMRSIINMHNPNGMMSQNQLSTLNQSQINTQLGLNMTGSNIAHTSPSPPASKSATPSPSSSINEDDQEEGNRVSVISSFKFWSIVCISSFEFILYYSASLDNIKGTNVFIISLSLSVR